MLENELQGQGAQVETQGRARAFRQGGVVLAAEGLTPVNVNVGVGFVLAANADELFFHQLLNLQARPISGLVDQYRIEYTHLQFAQQ
ncbi:hypothetical protein D3C84_1123440 [compost metagenome]